jgi:hypothetical protein
MGMLQKAAKIEDDDGFERLNNRSLAESEFLTKYQKGEVDNKKSSFEQRKQEENLETGPDGSRPQSVVAFSWSRRFDKDMPAPAGSYSEAQKHNQFRKYYGYHPSEAPSVPPRNTSRMYLQTKSGTTITRDLPPYLGPPPYNPQQATTHCSGSWGPRSLPVNHGANTLSSARMTNTSIPLDSRPAYRSNQGLD